MEKTMSVRKLVQNMSLEGNAIEILDIYFHDSASELEKCER